MCVQRFDDSLDSAIHTTYRISLRSSSMPEPRDPLLKIVTIEFLIGTVYCWYARKGLLTFRRRVDPAEEGRRCVSRRVVIRSAGRGFPPPDLVSVMILPQVHLRKPCYDFYFL